jgi:hypothetical protein
MTNNDIQINLNQEEFTYLFDILENNFATISPSGSNKDRDNIFTKLQGKIIAAGAKRLNVHKIFNQLCENRVEQKDLFTNKPLFMGAGIHTQYNCSKLHKRLKYALYVLGGKQQNGGQGTEFDISSDNTDSQEIKNALKDIISAFDLKPSDLQ